MSNFQNSHNISSSTHKISDDFFRKVSESKNSVPPAQGKINFSNVTFIKSATNIKSCPCGSRPEIAVAGRSNVGKSSFINTLFNRNRLAKVSQKPGKTSAINYFDVSGMFYIVDLPGYGFARVSKAQKALWSRMMNGYLNNRNQLKYIIFLLDVRHTPSDDDFVMYEWIKQRNIRFLPVASKCDKIKASEVDSKLNAIRQSFNLKYDSEILLFSSLKKLGVDQVKSKIEGIILND